MSRFVWVHLVTICYVKQDIYFAKKINGVHLANVTNIMYMQNALASF